MMGCLPTQVFCLTFLDHMMFSREKNAPYTPCRFSRALSWSTQSEGTYAEQAKQNEDGKFPVVILLSIGHGKLER